MNAASKEAAVFYALDLLETEERRAFEDRLVSDLHLRQEVVSWQNCIGDLSLSTPPGDPSPGLLASIHAEIDAGKKPTRSRGTPIVFWSGWAAAACFAILAAWLFFRSSGSATTTTSRSGGDHPGENAGSRPADERGSGKGNDTGSNGSNALADGESGSATPGRRPRSLVGNSKGGSIGHTRELQNALRDMEGDLKKLRTLHHQRFTPAPGQARLVIFEMFGKRNQLEQPVIPSTPVDPGDPDAQENTTPTTVALTSVSALASAVLDATHLAGPPLHSFTLSPESFEYFGAFVASSESVPIIELQGDPGEGAPALNHEIGSSHTPSNEPIDESTNSNVEGQPQPGQEFPTAPDALMFFDETSGQGSLRVQDLPPPADGREYQLWMIDPRVQDPIPLALLPEMDGNGAQIEFDLPGQGYAPSRFLLTEEPAGGSSRPSESIILESPAAGGEPRGGESTAPGP